MSAEALLTVDDVVKTFEVSGGRLQALRGVSLTVRRGETLGIVGESGSGKSTLARLALGLIRPDRGAIHFRDVAIHRASGRTLKAVRRRLQLVFQDAGAALNPRMTVGANIMDPLVVQGIGTPAERRRRVEALLEQVGLPAFYQAAYPFELSGGQQQRVLMARALALDPELLVCDEIVSALDVSVQAQILALLDTLRVERGLTYLFISHNLAAVAYVSARLAVMYLGEVVEWGVTDELLNHPRHPYTAALFDSVLELPESPDARRPLRPLPGEIPSPLQVPAGCAFASRCPRAQDLCRTTAPALRPIGEDHDVRCHFPLEA